MLLNAMNFWQPKTPQEDKVPSEVDNSNLKAASDDEEVKFIFQEIFIFAFDIASQCVHNLLSIIMQQLELTFSLVNYHRWKKMKM